MKLCGDTVTVFNARVDPQTGDDRWWPTVIRGVSWHATDASAVDAARGGLVAANRCTVRIPAEVDTGGKTFVDAIAYRDAADADGLWTLEGGTILVKAEVPEPAPSEAADADDPGRQPGGWTPAALRRAFADCVTALAVTDNRRAPRGGHWKVVGT